MNENFKFVTSDEDLKLMIPTLHKASSLAIDIEFDNKYSYDLVICLIQISTGREHFVVDPFEVDVSQLKSIFENPDVIKIFFAGIQDIQLLQTTFGWKIRSILDVSTIYQIVNDNNNQTSLNDVINDTLDVKLPKDKEIQSKEDWKQRPLPFKMQLYAARDVIYLHKVLIKLQNQLTPEQKEMLELYFMQIPLIVDQVENTLMYAFHLCNKYRLQSRTDRYLMFRLVQFREQTGELTNTSSGYILSKSMLKTLVKTKPRSIHDLKNADIYYHGVKQYAHELLELIRPVVHHNELPGDLFYSLEQTYKIHYPHYKYLDRQYNWPYEIKISTYRTRRGMLKILKAMLKERVDENLSYIYTSYLNHQIALHEDINLLELRRSIEEAESTSDLISVMYDVVLNIYKILDK